MLQLISDDGPIIVRKLVDCHFKTVDLGGYAPMEKECPCCGKAILWRDLLPNQQRMWRFMKFCSATCRSTEDARNLRSKNGTASKRPFIDLTDLFSSDIVRSVPHDPRFAVSRDGRVFSNARCPRGKWHELKPYIRKSSSRYLALPLGWGNIWFVHRLVLLCFVGASELQTRHLDGNPLNNNLKNLSYGTAAENGRDKVRHRIQRLSK